MDFLDLSSKILKKIWMTMNEIAQDLTEKILKKFWMAMSEAKGEKYERTNFKNQRNLSRRNKKS